jgi:transketolase
MRNVLPWLWKGSHSFSPDMIEIIYESNPTTVDISICSTGSMSPYSPKIAQLLEAEGKSVRIFHFLRIKPLDLSRIQDKLSQTRIIITLEEHNVINGFGAQLTRKICELFPKDILCIGIDDRFGQSGKMEDLFREYGLTPPQIVDKIIHFFSKKK